MLTLDAAGVGYRELNRMIEEAAKTDNYLQVKNVLGQRYLGTRLRNLKLQITLEGVPGNDLAAFLAGPTLIVEGSAQDGVGNTMDSGQVIINGTAGDALGYGMRGGRLLIKGDVGYRVGIHMKEYQDKKPVIVVGGSAGDFLGEYMAGGIIIVLNLNANNSDSIGYFCGNGMHGGNIYIRGDAPAHKLGREVVVSPLTDEDWDVLRREVGIFAQAFSLQADEILDVPFVRLHPGNSRPYGKLYA